MWVLAGARRDKPAWRSRYQSYLFLARHGSDDDLRNLTFDTAGSAEYCLGIFRQDGSQLRRNSMARRKFLSQLLGLPFLALGVKAQESKKTLKVLMRSSWGTDYSRARFLEAS